MHDPSRLVLASGSRWRRQLLDRLQIPYTWASPDIDETPLPGEAPEALVRRLALAKAERLAEDYPQHLIIGSDQVAVFDDVILGKPGNAPTAREQLRRFSGQRVRFLTGLALIDTSRAMHRVCHESYTVLFRQLSEQEIDRYVALERPFECAGSFRMEGLGIALFARLEGDDPNILIGLPLIRLCQLLREAGLDPLGS
ncbi:Maf family nucleotide pyrophosphatase [Halomonas sp. McH1-25]|uniref:Maf family protein n=1 Tax=unclassified Halomonas TaxID=2609666 RepID=UPI001EF4210E|nr:MULTISPECIES: Maf family protein [unclassified Halomonas]MCG7601935.1 Maf family nucleotide pyrophosphatase [Halomonas sp. McH1-25]MCP1341624.1 Maf family nucleotide pyrophosphatase [Halomonas sp. FL8]MCP1361859.1 Maf family nucleotide pyrophosphatase [Halomonas sp. BBD45]MCP1366424.1 Maf family nucleotide pyrophosphatase [Halomonas sp. BBD48]